MKMTKETFEKMLTDHPELLLIIKNDIPEDILISILKKDINNLNFFQEYRIINNKNVIRFIIESNDDYKIQKILSIINLDLLDDDLKLFLKLKNYIEL